MHLTCPVNTLAAAWHAAASLADPRHPVRSHVLLAASPTLCQLSGTNTESYLQANVPEAVANESGRVLLNGQIVSRLLGELAEDQDLAFVQEGSEIVITAGRATWRLPTADPSEFPAPPEVIPRLTFTLPAADLKRVFAHVAFAAKVETNRYATQCVCLEIEDGDLWAVSTDGRRMAFVPAEISQLDASFSRLLIPTSAVPQLRLFREGDVTISGSTEVVRVASAAMTFWTRQPLGAFPKWRDITNCSHTSGCTVNTGQLLRAVKQAMTATDQASVSAELAFRPTECSVSAGTEDQASPRAAVRLPIELAGPPLTFRVQPRYLCDYLSVVDQTKDLRLQFSDNNTQPLSLTHHDGSHYLVMPIGD